MLILMKFDEKYASCNGICNTFNIRLWYTSLRSLLHFKRSVADQYCTIYRGDTISVKGPSTTICSVSQLALISFSEQIIISFVYKTHKYLFFLSKKCNYHRGIPDIDIQNIKITT